MYYLLKPYKIKNYSTRAVFVSEALKEKLEQEDNQDWLIEQISVDAPDKASRNGKSSNHPLREHENSIGDIELWRFSFFVVATLCTESKPIVEYDLLNNNMENHLDDEA